MAAAREPTRWTFHDATLLHLFPITYLLHLTEEWVVAAPIALWTERMERPLAAVSFLALNAMGLVLMAIGIRLVRRGARFHWIVPALATAVLLNTAGHLVGSSFVGTYSAGLITAVILWVPLGLLTLIRVWDQATTRTLAAGVIVGVAVELVVVTTLRL